MILKAILCVQHFCSFGAVIHCKSAYKNVFHCCVCYHSFSLKSADLEDTCVNWLNLVYGLKFTSPRPDSSK